MWIVRLLKKVLPLRGMVTKYISPADVKVDSIRTDDGGEFEGDFQQLLDGHDIIHELMPPDMPEYNDVAEQALGLTITMLQVTAASNDHL